MATEREKEQTEEERTTESVKQHEEDRTGKEGSDRRTAIRNMQRSCEHCYYPTSHPLLNCHYQHYAYCYCYWVDY